MKIFAFIMSFFLLYMSCLPCGDSRECNTQTQVEISASASHQEHQHESEACSPFCSCSCCPTSAYYFPSSKPQLSKISFQAAKYAIQQVAFITQAPHSIWQPPKVC